MIDYTKEIERLQQAQATTIAAKSADPSFAQNASVPLQLGTPPTYRSNAVRVVSWGMLVPVAFLLWFAWQASEDVWDGYYLRPFQAMFLVMPLLMALGVLWTRQMVLQKMHAPEQVSVADTGQKMRDATRWLSPLIIVLMLASFGSMFALPRGLPLAKWLGRPDPVQLASQNSPARAASVAA